MTEAEFKKLLDAAEKSPKEIAAAVSGLSEKVLRFKPSPEKWCVLEILEPLGAWIKILPGVHSGTFCHGHLGGMGEGLPEMIHVVSDNLHWSGSSVVVVNPQRTRTALITTKVLNSDIDGLPIPVMFALHALFMMQVDMILGFFTSYALNSPSEIANG